MYCKHCGKLIDDDSKFCKECGNSLLPTDSSKNYIDFFQKHIVFVALIVIWYIVGYLYSSVYYDRESSGIIFGMYLITPIIIGLLYWVYKKNCKYQIQLFNKTDSKNNKLLKYAYLTYTYFIPFACSDGLGDDYFIYFVILSFAWLIPTLIICGIYYYIQYNKDKKIEYACGWRVKNTRPFSPEEIAAVTKAEVVSSQYGNSVCFSMNGGKRTYVPLSRHSSLTVGDSVDLKTAKLVTLCREGEDDIYRVIEK